MDSANKLHFPVRPVPSQLPITAIMSTFPPQGRLPAAGRPSHRRKFRFYPKNPGNGSISCGEKTCRAGQQCRRLGCSEAETQHSRTSPGDGESTPGENPQNLVIASSTRNPVRQSDFPRPPPPLPREGGGAAVCGASRRMFTILDSGSSPE
jgi:hypothetical protein